MCNACGLFLKLHGRPRPISLKTDVIKSRNRVRSSNGAGTKKKQAAQDLVAFSGKHPDATEQAVAALDAARRVSASHHAGTDALHRSQSPLSRTVTPSLAHSHPSNIAPQSMFDSVTLEPQAPFYTTGLHDASFRAPSPRSDNGTSPSDLANHHSIDAAIKEAEKLRIRVSELEVINGLFRGRVAELENSHQDARVKEQAAVEAEKAVRLELDASAVREVELKRRIDDLESELNDLRDGPRTKRLRLSDFVDDGSQASTPSTHS